MAGQGWGFHDLPDNGFNYEHIQGAIWADLSNADELGEHWSSDTWNEPHAEHVADQNTTSGQPQHTSQYTSHHTSHAQAPPSSPPRYSNYNQHQHFEPPAHATNTHHAPAPYPEHYPVPAAQSETSYHQPPQDLTSPYRPANFTGLPPHTSQSRGGLESFLRRPNREEEARNNAINQSILDNNSQVVDSDSDGANMPRTHRTVNSSPVDLTQSPGVSTTQQSRTRKRGSTSDGGDPGSARKRTRRPSALATTVVDDDEVFEDEAPSAEAELLQAQQQEALKMQETNKEGAAVKIGKRSCIICLESYTNATTAICGHIFCHECLTRALMASEKNNDRGKGNCPACRKAISRKNAKEVIPISFLKKSAFKTKGRQAHNQ